MVGSQESNQDVFETTESQASEVAKVEAGQAGFFVSICDARGPPSTYPMERSTDRGRRGRPGQRFFEKGRYGDQP